MQPKDFFAHTRGANPRDWERLESHAECVAATCAGFAEAFGAKDLGEWAGRWHDIGKLSPEFQQMLRDSAAGRSKQRVDHSTAGARHALNVLGREHPIAAQSLVYVIAGHHAGLADAGTANSEDSSCLSHRLTQNPAGMAAALRAAEAWPKPASCAIPSWLDRASIREPFRFSMLTRMLFSCLIDADRLEAAAFDAGCSAAELAQTTVAMADLRACLDAALQRCAPSGVASTVQRVRAELLTACRSAAALPPGFFSLTAPTGSGKTLSSMAFALSHAETHGLRRVVYALPYTSIIEQNAAIFRRVFAPVGDDVVLEHHSAVAERGTSTQEHDADPQRRKRVAATENWDAPLIVTTNVRLLESLFASDANRCRRLHRLVRSVIILDECQSLPAELLRPTLLALQELVERYGCTIVFCTATMPAITRREGFDIGLPPESVREIVPDPAGMSRALRRVRVTKAPTLTNDELVDRLAAVPQALLIVNTRPHAAALLALAQSRGIDALHLSASMCVAHRRERIEEVRRWLKAGSPCRLICTQVVEAGVDLDFPLVLRAMAGLDSIIQAAGRCNREGHLSTGEVIVFDTEVKPPSSIRDALGVASQVLASDDHDPTPDPLDLDTMTRYFQLLCWSRGGPTPQWDGPIGSDGRRELGGITGLLSHTPEGPRGLAPEFRTADRLYRLIDNDNPSVVVPFGDEGDRLIAEAIDNREWSISDLRRLWRRASAYTVGIFPDAYNKCFVQNPGATVEDPRANSSA
ncbi:MAG: CRISPR-associated helicase Cas3' [Phycisphaerae bacterium]|nr:CRISPR-associated helicase Cas3' [Phycisphaerae bacterium]